MTSKKYIEEAPGGWPLLGHAWVFRKNPVLFFQRNSAIMGPLYSFKIFGRTIHVINDPNLVHEVLVGSMNSYSRRKSYAFLRELLGEGLITSEGEHWRKNRRTLQPGFKREQLNGLIQGIQSTTDEWIDSKLQSAPSPTELHKEMSQLTLRILTRSIIDTQWDDAMDAFHLHLSDAWDHLSAQRFRSGSLLKFGNPRRKQRGEQAIAALKETIGRIVHARRQSKHEASDLLAMLMSARDEESGDGLSDQELIDEVMTLVIAGHETTASALTWTLHCLALNPAWIDRIREEVKSFPNGPWPMEVFRQLDVTGRVLQEGMRLFPPVWTFGRRTLDAIQLGEFLLPSDTSVTMPLVGIHRHAKSWSHPDSFNPDHFLPDAVQSRPKFAYFPFGGGQRMCIGSHYAMMEMQCVLARLLNALDIELKGPRNPSLSALVTLQPGVPLPCVFKPRKSS